MSGSVTSRAGDADFCTAVESLLGCAVRFLEAGAAGANSRVLAIEAGGVRYALKCYPDWRMSGAARCRIEWRALDFLCGGGIQEVPCVVAACEDPAFVVLEWIEGRAVSDISDRDVDAAADFVARVAALSRDPDAMAFPEASEACLSGSEIVRQINDRRGELIPHPLLDRFLDRRFMETFYRAEARSRRYSDFENALNPELRCLIPADFGLHNALREPGGRLRFFDFDYFGWDDPVKLTADFCLHPAMHLSHGRRRRFRDAVAGTMESDTAFTRRLDAYMPLFALRWALIILNVFRCDRAEAGGPPDEQLARAQIAKAENLLARAEAAISGPDGLFR